LFIKAGEKNGRAMRKEGRTLMKWGDFGPEIDSQKQPREYEEEEGREKEKIFILNLAEKQQ